MAWLPATGTPSTPTDSSVIGPRSNLPYVFGEFVDADVAHHTEGHGLSLAIARQIVLAHSGTIDVESTQGEGTTFTVHLPLAA
jgi:two-component system sensor histidine kinase ResE